MTKWRPDIDVTDPDGWRRVGVCRRTWHIWRKRKGIERSNLFWEDRDWAGEAQKLIEQGRVRHIGDLSLQLGLPFETLCTFAVRYRRRSKLYDLIGTLPRPGGYYSGYARHITRPTIQLFNALRAKRIADGMDELEATHSAADDADRCLQDGEPSTAQSQAGGTVRP
jgi:hypothetical protein